MLWKSKSAYLKRLNPKDVKKAVNKNKQTRIPPLAKDDFIANSDVDKANMLNSFFSSCFNSTHSPISKKKSILLLVKILVLWILTVQLRKSLICYLIFRWVKQVDLIIYHLVC